MKFSASVVLLAALTGCSMASGNSAGDVSGTLFVANKRDNSLSRIDLVSGEESARVETCADPHELSVSPDQSKVMVACYSGRKVQVFQTADLAPAYSIQLGDNARVHSLVWQDDGQVVAGAEGRGSLFILDAQHSPDMEIREIAGSAPGPHMIAVNGAGTAAWGTIIPTGSVVRYDLESGAIAGQREIADETEALALSPDEASLWVGSNAENLVYRLNAETLETEAVIAVGRVPIRIAAHPAGTFVATSNFGGGDLSVIDTQRNTLLRTIRVSGEAEAQQVTLVFSPDGERLYVAETGWDEIAEVDFASGEVLRRLPAGEGGDGLAIID